MRRRLVLAAVLVGVVGLSVVGHFAWRTPTEPGVEQAIGRGSAPPRDASSKEIVRQSAPIGDFAATMVDRKVITHAQLAIEVAKLDEAQAEVLRITTRLGGYVQSSNFNNFAENPAWDFTLRIPSDKSAEAVELLSALGTVQRSGSNRQDVTEEYMDLEARLAVMRSEEIRLLELLRRANTIDDYLKVETHLTRVRIEIEQATGRLKLLAHNVDMATIVLQLTPVQGAVIPKAVGFAGLGRRLSAAFRQGLNTVVEIISGTLVVVVAALPLLIIIVPLLVIGLIAYRRMGPRIKPPAAS